MIPHLEYGGEAARMDVEDGGGAAAQMFDVIGWDGVSNGSFNYLYSWLVYR